MNFMYLYNLNYTYRVKTEAIFKNKEPYFFEFFSLNDVIFEQHYLFKNLWRETLLMNHFNDPRVQKIKSFGQLPGKTIFREIDEIQGMTLQEYIDNRLLRWQEMAENS